MSIWKEGRVRARLARQGGEDRAAPPAKKKAVAREWLIVAFGIEKPWRYVRLADGSWEQEHRHDPPIMEVRSRHRTEADARRELEKHEPVTRRRRCFIAHEAVYLAIRSFWI